VNLGEVERSARARWLVWLAVACLGWFLFRQLSLEWRINPQYSYGWVVPLLAFYLVAERWKDRPAPTPAPGLRPGWIFWMALALIIPLRLVQEANPDWRLTNWMAAFLVLTLLWIGFATAGGRAWGRHFAFATAFILTAAPWPTPIENALVQTLMQSVASIAVEILNWLGIAAEQQGNLIRLTGGTLGVDEACSGVRSFQATIMVALCLGELHRLHWKRRVALLVLGSLYALFLNLLRATLLAVIGAKSGIAVAEKWHDPAGYALLGLVFAGLWLSAKRFDRGPAPSVPAVIEGNVHWPIREAIAVLLFLSFAETTTEAWYRWHEMDERPKAKWNVAWPQDQPGFARAKIAENIRLVLRFNQGDAAVWNRADGSRWHLYFFSWNPGRAAAQLARSHRPETCLPATGFEFVQNRGLENLRVDGLTLPVERLEFKSGGQRWHVYYCLWEDMAFTPAPEPLSRESRLRAVWQGRRLLGQRVLEVVIQGLDSPEKADAEFEKAAREWIRH